MKHLGTIQLETDRLILRRFELSDAEAMFNNWGSDIRITEFAEWKRQESVEQSESHIRKWIEAYENLSFYHWAVVPKLLDEPVGTVSVTDYDDKRKMVQIGFCLGKEWWNRNFMSESMERAIDFFFQEVGVERIESYHNSELPICGLVMRKCGFKLFSTSRRSTYTTRGYRDISLYELELNEYIKHKE